MIRHPAVRLTLIFAASGALLLGAGKAGYRINTSASMPLGLWHVEPTPAAIARGMIVVVCLPPRLLVEMALRRGYIGPGKCSSRTEPLLKPVIAVAGDIVQVTAAGILVDGSLLPRSTGLAHDSAGRPLQPVPAGRYEVGQGQVWLVSSAAASFDSRYWGPVPVMAIRAIAHPVWVFR